MNRKIFGILLSAVLMLCAAGCSSQSAAVESGQSSAVQSTEKSEIFTAGTSSTVAAGGGFYRVEPVFPNSVSILYTDLQLQTQIYLCADPNCLHNSESCTSYIPNGGLFPPILAQANGRLYLMFNAGEEQKPYMMSMDYNGEDRKTLCEFSSNQTVDAMLCADENDLYCVVRTATEESDTVTLCSIGLDDGVIHELQNLASEERSYTLLSCIDGDLIFSTNVDGEKRGYCTYNVASGRWGKIVFTYSSADGGMISGHMAYTYDADAEILYFYNFETDQESEMPLVLESDQRPLGMRGLYDGKFLFTAVREDGSGTFPIEAYIVDTRARTCTPMTLNRSGKDGPVSPVRISGDWIYTVIGYESESVSVANPDGTSSMETQYLAQYALIRKEDYEASNPNYIRLSAG